MKFYSQSTRGFYDEAVHGKLGEPGCLIPADAVEVLDDVYSTLLLGQTSGKEIVPDANGEPVLQDPVPTDDQLATAARAQRDALLANADNQVNTLEDNGSDTTAWRTYRKALRDVPSQSGFPRTITWPTQPQ